MIYIVNTFDVSYQFAFYVISIYLFLKYIAITSNHCKMLKTVHEAISAHSIFMRHSCLLVKVI